MLTQDIVIDLKGKEKPSAYVQITPLLTCSDTLLYAYFHYHLFLHLPVSSGSLPSAPKHLPTSAILEHAPLMPFA